MVDAQYKTIGDIPQGKMLCVTPSGIQATITGVIHVSLFPDGKAALHYPSGETKTSFIDPDAAIPADYYELIGNLLNTADSHPDES